MRTGASQKVYTRVLLKIENEKEKRECYCMCQQMLKAYRTTPLSKTFAAKNRLFPLQSTCTKKRSWERTRASSAVRSEKELDVKVVPQWEMLFQKNRNLLF